MTEVIDNNNVNDVSPSPMQQFYQNKSIFVTGGTGFLGKVIIEKLLRTCQIDTIYVLIRSKKGKDIATRIEDIVNDVVFTKVKQQDKEEKFRHKIVPIEGDCSLPGLGISESDRRKLIDNVQIILHAAATVRFDEKLKLALAINVNGTKEIMILSRQLKTLVACVHVSTAYANCNRSNIDERIYRTKLSGSNAIKMAECFDEKTLEQITPTLIGDWPNTYTFTKALAEDLVKQMCKRGGDGENNNCLEKVPADKKIIENNNVDDEIRVQQDEMMPVTIFRPAIVIPTAKEPVVGWIDNMYGPTGIIVGVGAGLLRIFYGKKENHAELVPVDMVVNGILASAFDIAQNYRNLNEPPVYNFVASSQNPITWNDYCKYGVEHGAKMPMMKSIWYWSFHMSQSRFLVSILTFLYHTLPALLIDTGLVIMQRKPKMLQVYRKIHRFCEVIYYFTNGQWYFTNQNVQQLWHKLTPQDQQLFFFDMAQINWSEVINMSIFGIRTYLMKEDPNNIPEALKRTQRLKILHFATVYSIYTALLYFVYVILSKFFLPAF